MLEQCIAADAAYHYEEYPEVRTQRDIENLLSATMHFHDGGVGRSALREDGTLYVRSSGVWCCTVELWFSQIESFHIGAEDGDDEEYCHFKARGLKYPITPIPRVVRKRRKLFGRKNPE